MRMQYGYHGKAMEYRLKKTLWCHQPRGCNINYKWRWLGKSSIKGQGEFSSKPYWIASSSRPGVPTREDEAGRGHDIDLVPCIHVQGKGEPQRTSWEAENSMAESTESLLIPVRTLKCSSHVLELLIDTCPTMISSQQAPKPWEKARGLTQFALAALWQQLGTCNSATASQPSLIAFISSTPNIPG